MLLLPRLTLPLAVTGAVEVKLAGELTVTVLAEPVPRITLPNALKALLALTVTGALAMTAAANVAVAATDKLLELDAPTTVLPSALNVLPAVMLTGALAVIGAVEAKFVTAFTSKVWLPLVPKIELPLTVTVLEELAAVTPPVKVARPLLSMVRWLTS